MKDSRHEHDTDHLQDGNPNMYIRNCEIILQIFSLNTAFLTNFSLDSVSFPESTSNHLCIFCVFLTFISNFKKSCPVSECIFTKQEKNKKTEVSH